MIKSELIHQVADQRPHLHRNDIEKVVNAVLEEIRTARLMPIGTVKWLNATKGYGFIQPQGGGKDVFVHISAVERAGLSTLNEGQTVGYQEASNRGKTSAENLRVQR
jgi:CspA family cold shock protein